MRQTLKRWADALVLLAPIVVWAVIVFAAVLLQGCALPEQQYVRADAATHNIVAPELWGYVTADSTRVEDEVEDTRRLLYSSGRRIQVGAAAAGLVPESLHVWLPPEREE